MADAAGLKRVANRIVAAKRDGNQVVVVVSAMGDTTDELIDLAEQITPIPQGRELDILLGLLDFRYFLNNETGCVSNNEIRHPYGPQMHDQG